ncbi:YitT family protein [Ideonella sp. 4Y16]|uniref:YitT family protein n=1 Tax=Ideonella alba TaxID=2824118 RepID=A0A941BC07_9BURK|nr:YitT family protein [Ideonella alba]MBQ0931440.1 YitT family protein [Ideonella alba]MBQ0944971.1 YitT family protein [Ideonella alba]
MNAPDEAEPQRHTLFDDAQALLIGTLFVSIGLTMFRHLGLMTGGTVGLAFLAHYGSGLPFGPLLFVINLPFYWLAWQRLGPQFTVKTLSAVTLLSGLSELMPQWLGYSTLNPLFAALAGGSLIGTGFIILFRHRASLGGLNTVVLWLQERYGWRAGIVQLSIDAAILLASWPFTDARRLALSVLGAVAMNFALAVNHKPGRYVAY